LEAYTEKIRALSILVSTSPSGASVEHLKVRVRIRVRVRVMDCVLKPHAILLRNYPEGAGILNLES